MTNAATDLQLQRFHNGDSLLWKALALSIALHAVSVQLAFWSKHIRQKPPVEIDITMIDSVGPPSPPHLAPHALTPPKPKAAPPLPIPKSTASQPPEPSPPTVAPTAPSAPAPSETPQEIGIGTGQPNLLSQLPKLLNLSDLSAILRRFYPEDERAEGHEGTVVVDLHIDADGHVRSVDVVRSAGLDFDHAAEHVALLLHFAPAFLGGHPVAVKMRQAIQFRLAE